MFKATKVFNKTIIKKGFFTSFNQENFLKKSFKQKKTNKYLIKKSFYQINLKFNFTDILFHTQSRTNEYFSIIAYFSFNVKMRLKLIGNTELH